MEQVRYDALRALLPPVMSIIWLPSNSYFPSCRSSQLRKRADEEFKRARRKLYWKQEATVLQEQTGKRDAEEFADLVATFNTQVMRARLPRSRSQPCLVLRSKLRRPRRRLTPSRQDRWQLQCLPLNHAPVRGDCDGRERPPCPPNAATNLLRRSRRARVGKLPDNACNLA